MPSVSGRRDRVPPDVLGARLQQRREVLEGLRARQTSRASACSRAKTSVSSSSATSACAATVSGRASGTRRASAPTPLCTRQQERRLDDPGRRVDQRQQCARRHQRGGHRRTAPARPRPLMTDPSSAVRRAGTPVRCRSACCHRSASAAPRRHGQRRPARLAQQPQPLARAARHRAPSPARSPRSRCPARRRPPRRCAGASWPPPSPAPRRGRRRRRPAAPRCRRAARRTRGDRPAAVGVVDDREGVHHQPGRVRGLLAGAREAVGALAGHRAAGVRQQPYREAPFEHVHQRGGGARDGPLEGRVRARALVGARPGCPAAPCSGRAAAAPRGAPSARRSARWSASAPGAGRRRTGSRAG